MALSLTKLSAEQRSALRLLDRTLTRGNIYLVGGTVRDLMLQRATKDIDVLVTGMPLATIRKSLTRYGTVALVGERFGVLKFRPRGKELQIDIALPRKEYALHTGGYRDFSFRSDPTLPVERDLERRDFTVNAMAYDLRLHTLLDPFGGVSDLRRKVLRTVGVPRERFGEDYSRLLRLLRFVVQLEFHVEPKTAAAARSLMPRLVARRTGMFVVPREVLAEQLVQTFLANPVAAFDVLDQYSVFRVLLPEVEALRRCDQGKQYHREGNVFHHTRLAMERLSSTTFRRAFTGAPPSALVIFGTLFHDIGKPRSRMTTVKNGKQRVHFYGHEEVGAALATKICERLKLTSYNGLVPCEDLSWLVRHHLVGIEQNVTAMRATTLAKYFSGERGTALLQVLWADRAASIGADGKPAMQSFQILRRRLNHLLTQQRGVLVEPVPLASGNDVMRWCTLAAGPKVGAILARIREAQLIKQVTTKQGARALAIGVAMELRRDD